MGEEEYIEEFPEIVKKVKNLKIINIQHKEIPCNLDDIVITFNNKSTLTITDTLDVVFKENHGFSL